MVDAGKYAVVVGGDHFTDPEAVRDFYARCMRDPVVFEVEGPYEEVDIKASDDRGKGWAG